MLFSPYAKDSDDWLSQLCQAQTFFALLSSVILETLPPDRSEARNMGALLVLLMALPVVVATWIELSDKEDKKRAKERMLLKTLKRFVLTPVWKKLMLKRAELGRKQREKEKGQRALLRARTLRIRNDQVRVFVAASAGREVNRRASTSRRFSWLGVGPQVAPRSVGSSGALRPQVAPKPSLARRRFVSSFVCY